MHLVSLTEAYSACYLSYMRKKRPFIHFQDSPHLKNKDQVGLHNPDQFFGTSIIKQTLIHFSTK